MDAIVTMDMSKSGYRLPMEAEWEFAARGGNFAHEHIFAGSNTIDDVAWYTDNSGSTTHQVGTKAANELGLYDVSGNVWQWCWGWYGSYPSGAQTDPTGPSSSPWRVSRGGSWDSSSGGCGVSLRQGFDPSTCNYDAGFRVVRRP